MEHRTMSRDVQYYGDVIEIRKLPRRKRKKYILFKIREENIKDIHAAGMLSPKYYIHTDHTTNTEVIINKQ